MLRPGVASLAELGAPSRRTPVTLLWGDGLTVDRALARWIGQRAAGERWAVVHGGASDTEAAVPLGAPDPDLAIAAFSAGCACCVAASAFALVLARLLRRGPWHRLLIVLPVQADSGAVADALLSGAIAPALADLEIVCVLQGVPPAGSAGLALRRAIAAADGVLIADGSRPDTSTIESLCAGDPGSDPFWLGGSAADFDWVRIRARLEARRDPVRWRWLESPGDAAARAAPLPTSGCYLTDGDPPRQAAWVWPASVVFDRRAIEAALLAVARSPEVVRVRAVMHTRREWYAFVADENTGVRDVRGQCSDTLVCHQMAVDETSGPDPQPAGPWAPTASRRESRIECLARPGRRLAAEALTARWIACFADQAAG